MSIEKEPFKPLEEQDEPITEREKEMKEGALPSVLEAAEISRKEWMKKPEEEIKTDIGVEQEINEELREEEIPAKRSQIKEAREARQEMVRLEAEYDKYKFWTGDISKHFKKEDKVKAKKDYEQAKGKYNESQNKLLGFYLEKAQDRWTGEEGKAKFKEFRDEVIFRRAFGREQERISQAKQETLSEQDKGRFREILGKIGQEFNKIPKGRRWVYTALLGTGAALGMGAIAAPAALGYASFRFGRAAFASFSALGIKKIGDNLEKKWLKEHGKGKREEKVKESLAEQMKQINDFEQMNKLLMEKREERDEELAKLAKAQKYWQVGKVAAMIGAGGGIAFCAGHFNLFGGEAEVAEIHEKLNVGEEGDKVIGMSIPKEEMAAGPAAEVAEMGERTYPSPFKVPEKIAAELERGEVGIPAAKPPTAAELYPDEGAEEKLYPDKGIGAPKEAPITKPEEAYQFPEEVEMVTPERGLAANFTLELGQGEVPSQLERVFHMMAADHMDKVTDASGMFTEEHGAKSLNIAANLVKLAEGRDVAGIDHGDFAKVVSWDAKTNSLEIRDYTQFNQMVDKLEDHADKLWQRDVLQKGAVAYLDDIKKGTWERIIHAQGLDKAGETETGIEGHDEVTADKITDFDKSEMVQEAEKTLEEVKAAVSPEVAEQIDEMVQKEELSPHEAIERAKKIGIAEEPIAGPEAEEKEAIRIREEAEKAAEKLEPLAEAQLDKVRLNLMDTYDMTLGESEAIFSETIGNLLKNTPEDLADIRERFGPDLDLKHDGWFSFGEYKKYCELANDVRTFGPKPEEMDMTVGEFIAKKLLPEFRGAKKEAVNIEL